MRTVASLSLLGVLFCGSVRGSGLLRTGGPLTRPERQSLLHLLIPGSNVLTANSSLANPQHVAGIPGLQSDALSTALDDVAADSARRLYNLRDRVRSTHSATLDVRQNYLSALQNTAQLPRETIQAIFPNEDDNGLATAASTLLSLPFEKIMRPAETLMNIERWVFDRDAVPTLPPDPTAPPCIRPGEAMKLSTSVTVDENGHLHVETSDPTGDDDADGQAYGQSADGAPPSPSPALEGLRLFGGGRVLSTFARLDRLVDAMPFEDNVVSSASGNKRVVITKNDAAALKSKLKRELHEKAVDLWAQELALALQLLEEEQKLTQTTTTTTPAPQFVAAAYESQLLTKLRDHLSNTQGGATFVPNPE